MRPVRAGEPVRFMLDTGRWSASQRSCHINVLEMQAVIYAVRDFLPHLRSWVVRLMCDNAVTVAYIKNEGGTRSLTLMQMTIRLLKCCDSKAITLVPVHLPGVLNIQADSMSRVGQTLTTEWTMAMESLRPMFAKWGELWIDLFATFANRRLVKFVSAYPDPREVWTDAMSMPWDYRRDLLVRVSVIQDGPASTAEDRSVTRSGGDFDRSTATGSIMVPRVDGPIPRRSDSAVRRRSRPTDTRRLDGRRGDRERHFRPSNLHAWKLSRPSWEQRVIPGKLPTWCQGAFGNLHNKCMNPIGQDSWRSLGRKDGKCFESEVIISAPTWCTSSGTDYFHRRYFYIARLWLLCYVIGCTIQQPNRTSSYWSGLSGWNVRCNAESCLSGTFIWFYHYCDRRLYLKLRYMGNPRMTSFP